MIKAGTVTIQSEMLFDDMGARSGRQCGDLRAQAMIRKANGQLVTIAQGMHRP